MLRVSQERVVKVVGVIIQNGRCQRYFFGVETYNIIVLKMPDRNNPLKYVQQLQQCYQNWHRRFLRMKN